MSRQNNRKEVWTNLSLAALARAKGSTMLSIPLSAAEGLELNFLFSSLPTSVGSWTNALH